LLNWLIVVITVLRLLNKKGSSLEVHVTAIEVLVRIRVRLPSL